MMRTHTVRGNTRAPKRSSPFVSGARLHSVSCPIARKGHGPAARDLYEIETRITQVDRAIIRGYLPQYYFSPSTGRAEILARMLKPRRKWMINHKVPRSLSTGYLPAELDRKLSVLPVGFERVLVGNDVLLVEIATRRIVDIMWGACGTMI